MAVTSPRAAQLPRGCSQGRAITQEVWILFLLPFGGVTLNGARNPSSWEQGKGTAAPEEWSPSCFEEASQWMFVHLFSHPPFINKFWSSFSYLPTLPFLTSFFDHNQALPPSGMVWLPSCQCFRSRSAQLAAWVTCSGTMALWRGTATPSLPPSLPRDVELPDLQPQTISLIYLPHCTINTLNSELEPDLSFLLLFNWFWTVPPALALSCTPPLSHDSGEFMAILQDTIKNDTATLQACYWREICAFFCSSKLKIH